MNKKLLLDINAQELNIGDKVEILTIPEWFIESLSPEDLKLLQSQIAKKLAIVDIDDYFVWLEVPINKTETEYESHLFGLEPNCLIKSK